MKLAAHIIRENKLGTVKTVAGIDVGMKGDMVCAPVLKKSSIPLITFQRNDCSLITN
jgi:hypothetical protein